MRLFSCDHHEIPLPPEHKFPVAKYRLIREALTRDGRFEIVPAPAATREDLERVHDSDYVSAFLDGTLDRSRMRRIGFPWSEGLVRRTLCSVGGTLAATQEALLTGIGGTLAGGTHHAFRSEGAGFCVFNDIAVAIRSVALRAAVIDLDVHQGDGTAAIFEDDPNVLTLSLHGAQNFPFRKQRSAIDIPFVDGTGDEEYLAALERALPRVFAFSPQIVFYQSGVDGLASDRLGRLGLTHGGLERRDVLVFEACKSAKVPVVVTLGGGYSDPIELTVRAHAATYRIARRTLGVLAPELRVTRA